MNNNLAYSTFKKRHTKTIKNNKFNKLKHTLHNAEDSDDDLDEDNTIQFTNNTNKAVETTFNTVNKNDDSSNNIKETMMNHPANQYSWDNNFNHSDIYNKKENDNVQINHLIEKMNNIILLLEENTDEKKGNVIEEVILYCFLGIFIIYLVDSFVRVGKYVR